ncbi:MAG: hypothetical protein EHM34_09360 [Nitrosopumilales archaeon]|nr:MAG: hypothetical protein EHM34_09360 [Nitrosopumilales archaeon]
MDELINAILAARYIDHIDEYLTKYFQGTDNNAENNKLILKRLLTQISDPILQKSHPVYTIATIPNEILENNNLVRNTVIQLIRSLILEYDENKIKEFFILNHENIKWAQNRWFVVNPGLGLELMEIHEEMPQKLLKWLNNNFGCIVGDKVAHLHVISNRGRERLRSMGVKVSLDHWAEEYWKDFLIKVKNIVENWNGCKGLICDQSWVFNPQNFEIAPDGKPFVSFSYLKNRYYYGDILDVTEDIQDFERNKQISFALRSERRKKYYEEKIFFPKIYATFASRKMLVD